LRNGRKKRFRGMMMWNLLWFTSILFIFKFYIEYYKWDKYSTMGLNYRLLLKQLCTQSNVLFFVYLKFLFLIFLGV
jgi:hypothetical protein